MINIEYLEKLVRDRDLEGYRLAARAFMRRRAGVDPDAVFQICEGYRRLGRYEEAYRLLRLDKPLKSRVTTSDFEGKRLLWAARLLSLMGATPFALPLLDQIDARTFEDHRIIGGIYLAHFDYPNAIAHLEQLTALDRTPDSYPSRLAQIVVADAHAGLLNYDEALKRVRAVKKVSSEPLLQGIALQAEGEYLARADRTREALSALQASAQHFAPHDRSADHAFLLKWLGYALVREGQSEAGGKYLSSAYDILRSNRMKPEAWLDATRLKIQAGIEPTETLAKIQRYPGLAPGFRALLGSPCITAAPARDQWIDLSRDEYRWDHQTRLGIPTELRLVAYGSLAAELGIPLVSLKSLLWAGEAYSFLQLENRIHQLIHRARHIYGIDLKVLEGILTLDSSFHELAIDANDGAPTGGPSFLSPARTPFKRIDVEAYYGLSRTQATSYLNQWLEQGWVIKKRAGITITYHIVDNFNQQIV